MNHMHIINVFCEKIQDNKIHIAYVIVFLASILFTFFFKKGIEFTRYALIILTIILIYTNANFAKPILKSPSFKVLICFMLVALASILHSGIEFGNIDETVNWTICYISGFMAFQILQTNAKLILFIIPIALFSSQILYPVLTLDQTAIIKIFSNHRLDLFFEGKPIHLGIFCGISAFIAAFISLNANNKILKNLYALLAISSLLLLLSTGARTSFIGTIVTFTVATFFIFRKKINFYRYTLIIFALTISALFFALSTQKFRIATITSPAAITGSFLERELIFKIAKESFFNSPIIGEGFDNFSEIYSERLKIYSQDTNFEQQYAFILPSSNNAHNFSLHFLAETGILGFVCMNIFWIYIIFSGFKSKNESAMIISGIFLLSYIALQFNMSLYGGQISTLLFSLAGLSSAAVQGAKNSNVIAMEKSISLSSAHKALQ